MARNRLRRTGASKALVLVAVLSSSAFAQVLNGHQVVLDGSGRLLSWRTPQVRAYGEVTALAFDRLKQMPRQANGLQTYFTHAVFDPITFVGSPCCPHHPAGVYAMFSDSALGYYAYSGDRSVITLVQEVLDYTLIHGMTPPTAHWANVPYSTSNVGDLEYRGFDDSVCGGCSDGTGVIQPDKIGEFGLALIRFYELTGEPRYRDAALSCANALASHVRPGDETHSPWPFRVNAETNVIKEEYTASTVGSIRLLDELIRLQLGNTASFQTARDLAWTWLKTYPMQNERWTGYFEDVPGTVSNLNQYVPMETARYLLDRPEYDADMRREVPRMLAFVERNFAQNTGSELGVQFGANCISEQNVDMTKMGSHTARYASINAAWYFRTGDLAAKEKAFRSFNWATYLCRVNGVVGVGVDGRDMFWYSDSYGDYIRHFHWGMAAVPEWAPPGENHLVRSSSIVKNISYAAERIEYATFDPRGTEVLRLARAPRRVLSGGTELTASADPLVEGFTLTGDILEVRHHAAAHVVIELDGATDAGTPDAGAAPDAGAEPTDAGMEPDAGSPTDAGVTPSPPPKACGCSAGPGLFVLLMLALARRFRAVRR